MSRRAAQAREQSPVAETAPPLPEALRLHVVNCGSVFPRGVDGALLTDKSKRLWCPFAQVVTGTDSVTGARREWAQCILSRRPVEITERRPEWCPLTAIGHLYLRLETA